MHSRQRACLAYIQRYQRDAGGVSPSFRQIAKGTGIKSPSHVHRILNQLEAEGWVERIPERRRALRLRKPVPPVPYALYHEGNSEFWVWDDEAKTLKPR